MMKKLLTIILTLIASTSIVSASTNLWEFYNEQGEQLPSFEFRKDFYEQILDEDEYKGTAKQNDLYLKYLQENYIIPAPKANEIKLGAFNPPRHDLQAPSQYRNDRRNHKTFIV